LCPTNLLFPVTSHTLDITHPLINKFEWSICLKLNTWSRIVVGEFVLVITNLKYKKHAFIIKIYIKKAHFCGIINIEKAHLTRNRVLG
jgi:hypothetical protein